jgi:4-diphosphocytidyl-2-C-methyl-D-erythritol kinase
LIAFPNCKINLGLNIIKKREDGYHNLETVFYPLPFYDVLEIIENKNPSQDDLLSLSGIGLGGDAHDNLCIKAYNLLKIDFPQLPAVKIYLHKNIPAGAGLGGGSADGAFMLQVLNKKFNLEISEEKLLKYALHLGSDCPFFILNKACFAQQRGEVLAPLEINLSLYKLLLVNPGIHINTQWAFSQVTPAASFQNLKDIIAQPVSTWKINLKNDFEIPVFSAYPEIEKIKNNLYEMGAIYAAMSGSGSTVYGIFHRSHPFSTAVFPGNYFIKELALEPIINLIK